MTRLYQDHIIRKQIQLDGVWNFAVDGEDFAYSMAVPGCWEQHPHFRAYRGKGVYRKYFTLQKNTNLRLIFKGVSHTCEVHLDGECIGRHYNAYTPFEICLNDVLAGKHELKLYIDNSFDENSALHIPNDYYTYGGITRPAALEYLPCAYIEYVHFTPVWRESFWAGEIAVRVQNLSETSFCGSLKSFLFEEKVISFGTVALAPGESREFKVSADFPEAKTWCCKEPVLYELNTQLYDENSLIDDCIERIGFRRIETQGNKILLNGEPVFFKGFCRHEDHSSFGCAIPVQAMAEDMELILQTGANAIRTSHYPNDERFLDMCDERGILVWEEGHARGLSLEQMLNPNFDKQSYDCIEEMIRNHYNHPSIVIWGILNECASDTEIGREKYKKQFEQIKQMDASRLTSFASDKHFTDICMDLPDVLSTNIYPLWYNMEDPAEFVNARVEYMSRMAGEEKPVIISETGAGAIYGYRSDTCEKWTEERQSMIIASQLSEFLNNQNLSGVFLWQFCDCRVTEEWFVARPKTYNNKGIVDSYRRKKLAFETVKKYYEEKNV